MREQLQQLRSRMKETQIDAYLIVSDDFHASEYVGEFFKCREFISGFNGSAGSVVVTCEEAGLWTDGRYFIQAESQLEGSGITLYKEGVKDAVTIADFLRERLPERGVLGFDGRTVNTAMVRKLKADLCELAPQLQSEVDLVGDIWDNRPSLPAQPVWELATAYAGESREEKIARVRQKMQESETEYFLIPSLDEIAWLLNVRGNDIAYNPVVLSYLLMSQTQITWYVKEQVVPEDLREKLAAAGVTLAPYMTVYQDLTRLPAGTSVLIDESLTNYALSHAIPKSVTKKPLKSPLELMKAIKNETEMNNEREAHRKDGIALTKLIYWLKQIKDKSIITELTVCEKLEELRQQGSHYLGQSFAPIAAYKEHGAIVHYEPDAASDVVLSNESFLLLDTGGQYLEGTTDVTRTIALGTLTQEQKLYYTTVLKGNLNLAAARFKYGCTGVNLDYLARGPLWSLGLDYNHGTGHGVGYLLNVHEGPNEFRYKEREGRGTILEEGMITSDEPGLYLEGKYGIRLESLVLCKESMENENGRFMEFETLTLAPFDMEAIDWNVLNDRERELLLSYQQMVYTKLADALEPEERAWLKTQTECY